MSAESADVDPFPVSELNSRYLVSSRQTINDRLKRLNIKPFKIGNKSYITADQLHLLDGQNEHLKSPGATLDNFPLNPVDTLDMVDNSSRALGKRGNQLDSVDTDGTVTLYPRDYLELIEAVVRVVAPAQRMLEHFADLERAAFSNWLLPTKDVQRLIGVKPRCPKGCDFYEYGCFRIVKTKKRIRGQTAWRVVKVVE